MKCTVSTSKSGVYKTQLIKYYLNLDEKVWQLCAILKYWAHFRDFKSKYKVSDLFFHLSAIFFLQQEPYRLPPVSSLQEDAAPVMFNDWNVAFVTYPFTSSALQKATLLELITGYFQFYGNFDYFAYLIAPFCGYPLEKTRLVHPVNLPVCYQNQNTSKEFPLNCWLCVQDPFQHSVNLTQSLHEDFSSRFMFMCRAALHFTSRGEKFLLFQLLICLDTPLKLEFRKTDDDVDDEVWLKQIGDLSSKIMQDIIKAECLSNDYGSHTFRIPNFCQSPFPALKTKMEKLPPEATVWDREGTFGSCLFNSSNLKDFSYNVNLKKFPTRVVGSTTSSACNHYLNFIYIRVMKFLSGKTDIINYDEKPAVTLNKNLGRQKMEVEKVYQEPSPNRYVDFLYTRLIKVLPEKFQEVRNSGSKLISFEEQALILNKKLTRQLTEVDRIYQEFSNDLLATLSPEFPQVKVYLYDTSRTTLSVCIENIAPGNGALELVKKLLRNSNKFYSVDSDSDFVRCTHTSEKTCILNLGSKLAVITNDLIFHYVFLDEKLEMFFKILIFWVNQSQINFSSKTILLLAIFYLQHEPYKLPSVAELQRTAPQNLVSGWNCSFTPLSSTPDSVKNSTLLDLVCGFFKFYETFDFTNCVISPYFGSSINKCCFIKPLDLPEYFQLYKEQNEDIPLTSFILQDPYHHSNNLTQSVSSNAFDKFASSCHHSARLLRKESPYSFFYCQRENENVDFILEKDRDQNIHEWMKLVKELLLKILQSVIFVRAEMTEENDTLCYVCNGRRDVMNYREYAMKTLLLSGDMDVIDKEMAISSAVVAQFPYNPSASVHQINLTFKNGKAIFTVKRTFGNSIIQFLYALMVKKLDRSSRNQKKHTEEYFRGKMSNTSVLKHIKKSTDFSEQVIYLLNQLDIDKNDIKQTCKIIETDLNSISVKNILFSYVSVGLHLRNTNLEISVKCQTLEEVKELISQSDCFTSPFISRNLITCKHVKTQIVCELNTDKNSEKMNELLKCYIHLNNKLPVLMKFIKFWADCHRLTDINCFSTSALYMLVIFFLQQCYKLPSVMELLKGPPLKRIHMLEKATVEDLFFKFLEFYSKFDYNLLVIAPYCGLAIKKTCFLKPYDLPQFYKNYINQDQDLSVELMCIQDVFDHSKNISPELPFVHGRFTYLCRTCLSLLSGNNTALLYNLLTYKNSNSVKLEVDTNDTVDQGTIAVFLEKMFTQVFRCQVRGMNRYKCEGYYNIWEQRIKCLKSLRELPSDELDKEIAVTSRVIEEFPKHSFWKIVVNYQYYGRKVHLEVFKRSEFPLFLHACHFIYTKLLKNFTEVQDTYMVVECKMENFAEYDNIPGTTTTNTETIGTVDVAAHTGGDQSVKKSQPDAIAGNTNTPTPMETDTTSTSPHTGKVDEHPSVTASERKDLSDMTDQLSAFITHLQTKTNERKSVLDKVFTDLVSTLGHRKIQFCGSSALNLNMENSNVDIYINKRESHKTDLVQLNAIKSSFIRSGKFTKIVVQFKSELNIIVLTAEHVATRLVCDLNIQKRSMLRINELFKYYLSLNEKVRSLMLVIKSWIHHYNFDKGSFSRYALNLMIFFYLQQEPHKLPSVVNLQNGIPPLEVDSWNCAFAQLKVTDFLKDVTIVDLVKGFFQFYGDFDYFSFVITPFFGLPVAKTRFLKLYTLPDAYKTYNILRQDLEVNTVMCVQDPFEHSKNITKSMTLELTNKFASLCRASLQLMKQNDITRLMCCQESSEFCIVKSEEQDEAKWRDLVKNLTLKILTKVLGCSIDCVFNKVACDTTVYECVGYGNILDNRTNALKGVLRQLHRNATTIDKEISVTRHIKENENCSQKRWKISVSITFKKNPTFASISVTGSTHFSNFIYTRLLKFLNCETVPASSESANKSSEVVTSDKVTDLRVSPKQVTNQTGDSNVSSSNKKTVTTINDTAAKLNKNASTTALKKVELTNVTIEKKISDVNQINTPETVVKKHIPDYSQREISSSKVSANNATQTVEINLNQRQIKESKIFETSSDDKKVDSKSTLPTSEQPIAGDSQKNEVSPKNAIDSMLKSVPCPDDKEIISDGNVSPLSSNVFHDQKSTPNKNQKSLDKKIIVSPNNKRVEPESSVSLGDVPKTVTSSGKETTPDKRNLPGDVPSTSQKIKTASEHNLLSPNIGAAGKSTHIANDKIKDSKLNISTEKVSERVTSVAPNSCPAKPSATTSTVSNQRSVTGSTVSQPCPNLNILITPLSKHAKSSIVKSSRLSPDFSQQISRFTQSFLADPAVVEAAKTAIYQDLQLALTSKIAFNKIYFFGSAITGLFSRESTFDIYINLSNQNIPKLDILESIRACLGQNDNFNCVFVATEVQTINFRHVKSHVNCKIHVHTRLPICTSLLINYYLDLDPKLRPLFFVIKSWAHVLQMKVNSYELYLMVIFYLQQEPYKLPSVADLQGEAQPDVINEWNGAFLPIQYCSAALSEASICQLVSGFFEFYSTFDYFLNVISPFFGKAIEKTGFLPPFALPSCYKQYCQNEKILHIDSSMCVQDPFEHLRNVAHSCDILETGRFAVLCRSAFHLTLSGPKDLLWKLMTQCNSTTTFEIKKEDNIVDTESWFKTTKSLFLDILTNILCCDIIKMDHKQHQGKKSDRVMHHIVCDCMVRRDIWQNRINILKIGAEDLEVSGSSTYDKDVYASDYISNQGHPIATNVCVVATFLKNPTGVSIGLDRGSKKWHILYFLYTRMMMKLKMMYPNKGTPVKKTALSAESMIAEPYKILVKGPVESSKIEELDKYFLKFGKFENKRIIEEETKLSIEYCFNKAEIYLLFIQQEHFPTGEKLKLFPLAPWKKPIPNAAFKDSRLAIVNSVAEYPTFTQQMNTFLHEVTTRRNERTRNIIRDDLISAMQNIEITLQSVGPNIPNLDIESDHLDICIEDSLTPFQSMEEVRNYICQSSNFCNISLVSERKTKYIVCKHIKTRTFCYLRISNKLMVISSQVIKYFFSLHTKLSRLATLIKFWADTYDLIGLKKFSNEALYMLVIFYLQQKPCNLPSVKDLQKDTTPDMVVGWNCAYAEFLEFKSVVLSRMTIWDLVSGFFRFYANFDYTTYVISPYFGSAIEKIKFLKPYDLPECFNQYISHGEDLEISSGICIQDFFEHSKNITSLVSLDCIGNFAALCHKALNLIRKEHLLLYKLLLHCNDECPSFEIEKKKQREQKFVQNVKTNILKLLAQVLNYKVAQTTRFDSGVSFSCVGEDDIWENRIIAWKNLSKESVAINLEEEGKITASVIKNGRSDIHKSNKWNLCVDLDFLKDPYRVKVTFKRKRGHFNMFHICQFVYTRLIKSLDEKTATVTATSKADSPKISEKTTSDCTSATETSDKKPEENKITRDEVSNNNEPILEAMDKFLETGNLKEKQKHTTQNISAGTPQVIEIDLTKLKESSQTISANSVLVECDQQSSISKAQEERIITPNSSQTENLTKQKECVRDIENDVQTTEVGIRTAKEETNDNTEEASRKRRRDDCEGVSDEDDVPSDFFDDFANEEFLDGLDIVDAWKDNSNLQQQNEEKSDETKIIKQEKEKDEQKRKKDKKKRHKKSTKSRSKSPRGSKNKRSRSQSREKKRRKKESSDPTRKKRNSMPKSPDRYSKSPSLSKKHKKRRRSSSMDTDDSSSPERWHGGRKKRKTFLEEITEKLNMMGSSAPPPTQVEYLESIPLSAPVDYNTYTNVMYPPQYYSLPPLELQQPVAEYYGGTTLPIPFSVLQHPQVLPPLPPPLPLPQLPVQPPGPQPISPQTQTLNKHQEKKEDEAAKLFASRKISFVQFLNMTTKREGIHTNLHLQNKEKILSRCENMLRFLSPPKCSALTVVPSPKPRSRELKYQSPLKKIPVVRFNFTAAPKAPEKRNSFSTTLDKLLQNAGIRRDQRKNIVEDLVDSVTHAFIREKEGSFTKDKVTRILKNTVIGPASIRNEPKLKIDMSIQCAQEKKDGSDVSLQVRENVNFEGSVTYLTSAYLLGKERATISGSRCKEQEETEEQSHDSRRRP